MQRKVHWREKYYLRLKKGKFKGRKILSRVKKCIGKFKGRKILPEVKKGIGKFKGRKILSRVKKGKFKEEKDNKRIRQVKKSQTIKKEMIERN